MRRSRTDASGNYVLDALPVESNDFVVTQPVTSTPTVYAAQASSPTPVSAGGTVAVDMNCTVASAVGGLSLELTPESTSAHRTWFDVSQVLTTGQVGQLFLIVRSVTASSGTSSLDIGTFNNLPANYTYVVDVWRSTSDAAAVLRAPLRGGDPSRRRPADERAVQIEGIEASEVPVFDLA